MFLLRIQTTRGLSTQSACFIYMRIPKELRKGLELKANNPVWILKQTPAWRTGMQDRFQFCIKQRKAKYLNDYIHSRCDFLNIQLMFLENDQTKICRSLAVKSHKDRISLQNVDLEIEMFGWCPFLFWVWCKEWPYLDYANITWGTYAVNNTGDQIGWAGWGGINNMNESDWQNIEATGPSFRCSLIIRLRYLMNCSS